MPARILLIGARSQRQGTGPFIAAGLTQAGAEICGIVGTSESTVSEALIGLQSDWGIQTTGHTDLASAIAEKQPDAVAVCSPWRYHAQHLALIADADCHCLVEKPLAWPMSETDAGKLISNFEQRKLKLQVVNQWPATLATFAELHGGMPVPVEQFTMRLSPISIGPDMVTDSAPHFIGMLQSLGGPGDCRDTVIEKISEEELQLHCLYQHANGAMSATLVLKTQQQRPRPAWYQVNELRADREVELPDYRQYLCSEEARVALTDPMHSVTAEFVRAVKTSEATQGNTLRAAHRNLLQLAAAWH